MAEPGTKRRALIVLTNHDKYLTKPEPTGFWLGELVHAYDVFEREGFEVDLVSPRGGKVPLDPSSTTPLALDKACKARLADPAFVERLDATLAPEQVRANEYECVFYAGGHGTMWDFPEAPELQEISRTIFENGGVVAAVCHGVAGLLNIRLSDGSLLICGKRLTGFSNLEEKLARLVDQVPFSLEDELRRRGANYKKGFLPLTRHAVADGRIVTGQNPSSTKAAAELAVSALRH